MGDIRRRDEARLFDQRLHRHSLTDALRGIRAAGFEGVEILADVPHAYPGTIDDAFTDRSVASSTSSAWRSATSTATARSATGRTRRRSRTSSRA
jgi:sugar phosphate isomerase/epimerase